ncbi:MAG: triose-phosphate isomerase, partial [Pseudomonadota bacterium]
MLADAGASYCIVGHSECRDELGDNDEILSLKVKAVLRAGLVPIFCVGESLAVRDDGNAESFVTEQLAVIQDVTDKVVVAYEPIWAIGTGRTPTTEQIEQMHTTMRTQLGGRTPLLYGGSVKPSNAEDILKVTDVNGALVGGASLKAEDFLAIASAA